MRAPVLFSLLAASAVVLSSGVAAGGPAVTPAAVPYGLTWTVDSADNAVVAYAAGASGAATPVATISGIGTGLDDPSGVAVDRTGQIYVANVGNRSITVYAAGASGAATPVATIAGASTGLSEPGSIAVGNGLVWVTDSADNRLEAYSADANGDVIPAETISGPKTLLNHPAALAINPEGGEVWVINRPTAGLPSIEAFGQPGDDAPDTRLHGANTGLTTPTALVVTNFFTVFVADSATNTISEFDAFAGPGGSKPFGRIRGASTGLDQPDGLAIDAAGRMFVSNAGNRTLGVYGPNASGDATPRRTVTGFGGAGAPASVAVLAGPPGSPTDVRVHAGSGSAHVTWKPPADTGGGISAYDVYAFPIPNGPGSYTTLSFDTETAKTSITLHRLTNGVRYLFEVNAHNVIGESFSNGVGTTATPYGPPGSPRGVTAVPGGGSLQVFWAPPAHDGGKKITRYLVQYAACAFGRPGCKAKTATAVGSERHVTLHRLASGTSYRVRVRAQTSFGVGQPSRVAKARAV